MPWLQLVGSRDHPQFCHCGWKKRLPRLQLVGKGDHSQFCHRGCISLASMTIPQSVTQIEGATFAGCLFLASITIPDSVTKIGRYAFHCCSSLQNVTIPSSFTEIGEGAFQGCSSLASVIIPDSIKLTEMAVGQNQWYHFGVGAPPISVDFSGDWDVHWGYGILTHGQVKANGTTALPRVWNSALYPAELLLDFERWSVSSFWMESAFRKGSSFSFSREGNKKHHNTEGLLCLTHLLSRQNKHD